MRPNQYSPARPGRSALGRHRRARPRGARRSSSARVRVRLERVGHPFARAGETRLVPVDGGSMKGLLYRLAARATGTTLPVRSDVRLTLPAFGPPPRDSERAALPSLAFEDGPGALDPEPRPSARADRASSSQRDGLEAN